MFRPLWCAPLVQFVKSLDNTENWEVLSPLLTLKHMDIGYLNTTDAYLDNTYNETPTDLIIGRRSSDADNENMIATVSLSPSMVTVL